MTLRATLWPEASRPGAASTTYGYPQLVPTNVIGGPTHMGLSYDDAAYEEANWPVSGDDYEAGNISGKIHWYAENATSGTCIWRIRMAATTPETDSSSIDNKPYSSTVTTVTSSHLGTTSKRIHTSDFTLASTEARGNLTANDIAWLGVMRMTSDTMSNDAVIERIELSE